MSDGPSDSRERQEPSAESVRTRRGFNLEPLPLDAGMPGTRVVVVTNDHEGDPTRVNAGLGEGKEATGTPGETSLLREGFTDETYEHEVRELREFYKRVELGTPAFYALSDYATARMLQGEIESPDMPENLRALRIARLAALQEKQRDREDAPDGTGKAYIDAYNALRGRAQPLIDQIQQKLLRDNLVNDYGDEMVRKVSIQEGMVLDGFRVGIINGSIKTDDASSRRARPPSSQSGSL